MKTTTKLLILLLIILSTNIFAQDDNESKIRMLEASKEKLKEQEKKALRHEVEIINMRLEKGEVTTADAEDTKKAMAQKRALNIENRMAIIDNKIQLLKRNHEQKYQYDGEGEGVTLRIGTGDGTNESFIYLGDKKYDSPRKYDRRTSSDLVLAFGFNNAIIEGESLDDSPYKFGGSKFFEIGWAWKTRVFENSNAVRIKYGFSFQTNGLKADDNLYFVEDGDMTNLEDFRVNLDKAKLRTKNLVFPVHFEFGPSKKIEKKTYFRYSTDNQFKIGIGGYAGFNIDTRQKLKYNENGDDIKEKIKRDYNTSDLVYGLSAYIAFDEVALYAKYDLSPIFKDQTVKQNNISLGVRFDMN